MRLGTLAAAGARESRVRFSRSLRVSGPVHPQGECRERRRVLAIVCNEAPQGGALTRAVGPNVPGDSGTRVSSSRSASVALSSYARYDSKITTGGDRNARANPSSRPQRWATPECSPTDMWGVSLSGGPRRVSLRRQGSIFPRLLVARRIRASLSWSSLRNHLRSGQSPSGRTSSRLTRAKRRRSPNSGTRSCCPSLRQQGKVNGDG